MMMMRMMLMMNDFYVSFSSMICGVCQNDGDDDGDDVYVCDESVGMNDDDVSSPQ